MRKFFVIAAIFVGLTSCVFAAENATQGAPQQEVRVPKTIFSFKSELGLSDLQIKNMQAEIVNLQNFINTKRKDLIVLQQDLYKMIDSGADLKQIKGKLEKISAINLDISYTDIVTSRNIEKILTKEQMKKWKELQQEAQKKIMEAVQKQQKEAASKSAPTNQTKK